MDRRPRGPRFVLATVCDICDICDIALSTRLSPLATVCDICDRVARAAGSGVARCRKGVASRKPSIGAACRRCRRCRRLLSSLPPHGGGVVASGLARAPGPRIIPSPPAADHYTAREQSERACKRSAAFPPPRAARGPGGVSLMNNT